MVKIWYCTTHIGDLVLQERQSNIYNFQFVMFKSKLQQLTHLHIQPQNRILRFEKPENDKCSRICVFAFYHQSIDERYIHINTYLNMSCPSIHLYIIIHISTSFLLNNPKTRKIKNIYLYE